MFPTSAVLIHLKYFFGLEYAFYVLACCSSVKISCYYTKKKDKNEITHMGIVLTPGFSGKPDSDSYLLLTALGSPVPECSASSSFSLQSTPLFLHFINQSSQDIS